MRCSNDVLNSCIPKFMNYDSIINLRQTNRKFYRYYQARIDYLHSLDHDMKQYFDYIIHEDFWATDINKIFKFVFMDYI